jgi:hypothetical protein
MLGRQEDWDNKLHSGKHAYCFHDVILLEKSLLTVTLTQYAHRNADRNSVIQCKDLQVCQPLTTAVFLHTHLYFPGSLPRLCVHITM